MGAEDEALIEPTDPPAAAGTELVMLSPPASGAANGSASREEQDKASARAERDKDLNGGNLEIERKYLVHLAHLPLPAEGTPIDQGYLSVQKDFVLRVRRKGDKGYLTLKGETGLGAHVRREFEYEIPLEDALQLLSTYCERPPIEKTRYIVTHEGHEWEVDFFSGLNAGLVVAEIELSREDEEFAHPAWLGPEVTPDRRFTNAALYERPFGDWGIPYDALVSEFEDDD